MATYKVSVDFVFSIDVDLEASSESEAEYMVMNANQDQIAHIYGRSYLNVADVDRVVKKVEIVE